MRRERQIIKPNCRLRAERVACRILQPDKRGEEGSGCGDGIGNKAEDIDGGIVNGETMRRAPAVVENRLGVEGGGPTKKAIKIEKSAHARRAEDELDTYYVHPSKL